MSILSPRPRALLRHRVSPAAADRTIPNQKIRLINRILSGDNVISLVKERLKERYATYIVQGHAESGASSTQLTRQPSGLLTGTDRDHAITLAFDAGFFEATSVYLLKSICEYTATVTGQYSRYSYSTGGDAFAANMDDIRIRGELPIAEQTADLYACGAGSCLVYLSTVGDNITADEVPIDSFYWAHAEQITDEGKLRPTNTSWVDECTVVVMCIGKDKWAAWFGESDDYPHGRHCTYTAEKPWEIPGAPWGRPPENGKAAMDYTLTGEYESDVMPDGCANPLTLHRQTSGDVGVPEYPFYVIRGHNSDGMLPTTNLDLYDTEMEYNVAASVVLGSAQESALGKQVLERGDLAAASGGNISDTIYSRLTVLDAGETMKQIGWSAINSKDAWETAIKQMRLIADAHHVPGFLIAPDWTQWPSGIALRQAQLTLENYRQHRYVLNKSGQRRRWQLMRSLMNMSEGSVAVSYDVKENWELRPLPWPEDPLTTATTVEKLLQLGVYDLLDAVQEVRDLETREQAMNYLKLQAKSKAKLDALEIGPKPVAQQQPPQTAAERLKARLEAKRNGQPQQPPQDQAVNA